MSRPKRPPHPSQAPRAPNLPQPPQPQPPASPKAARPAPPAAARGGPAPAGEGVDRRDPGVPDDPAGGGLDESALAALQARLDRLPDGFEPLDVVMIDGFLCGLLLQPDPVPESAWLPMVFDLEGRPPPPGFDTAGVRDAVERRRAWLAAAIERRDWFDPWIYELDEDASPSETVMPWVAGFAAAVEAFPRLMQRHEAALLEPLAALYRHLDPQDLEDAEDLLEEIETLEPPATLAEAVEDLVRSTLLIADVVRPRPAEGVSRAPRRGPPAAPRAGGRGGPGPGPRSRSGRR